MLFYISASTEPYPSLILLYGLQEVAYPSLGSLHQTCSYGFNHLKSIDYKHFTPVCQFAFFQVVEIDVETKRAFSCWNRRVF